MVRILLLVAAATVAVPLGILLVFCIAFVLIAGRAWVETGEYSRAIERTFDGQVDPRESMHEFECFGRDCAEIVRALPAASGHWLPGCAQALKANGACCPTQFGDNVSSEVHVFRIDDGSYRFEFTTLACRDDGGRWHPCDDRMEPRL